jgi:3-phenylpropionate/trans-cinnamate dioxygenase ferredoxin component
MESYYPVAHISDLPEGKALSVLVKGHQLAIFNLNGTCHAIDDTCTYCKKSLSRGVVEGDTVTCSHHFSRFSITSGNVMCPPAQDPVNSYPARVSKETIEVAL